MNGCHHTFTINPLSAGCGVYSTWNVPPSPKAKPQVGEIEKLKGTAKPKGEVRAGIKSLSLLTLKRLNILKNLISYSCSTFGGDKTFFWAYCHHAICRIFTTILFTFFPHRTYCELFTVQLHGLWVDWCFGDTTGTERRHKPCHHSILHH